MKIYRQHTPIEEHRLRGQVVHVKRDDLFGMTPAPPLGKLRGLRVVIQSYYDSGCRLIGSWDTRVSRLGEGLAVSAGNYPALRVVVAYPTKRGESVPPQIVRSQEYGAEIHAIRGNVTPICFRQASKYVEEKGGKMLPFGLECEEAVAAVADEARTIPEELTLGGSVVVCSGSGVTLAGIIRGLPTLPEKIVALSSGRSVTNILACVKRNVDEIPPQLEILPAIMNYYDKSTVRCPFPCHPHYDLKAWQLLTDNLYALPPPRLFWNIGA